MSSSNLEHKRHTLAHLLAAAILKLYPDAKRTIGPAIDNGFYFDFDFPAQKPGEEDLIKIEEMMREELLQWKVVRGEEVTADEARAFYKNNEYKLELIDEITEKGESLSIYTAGPEATSYKLPATSSYSDLCKGGHLDNPAKEIDPQSFTLSHIAGAYWRGDEKNTMLTRIYGLAFDTKEELEKYINQREEAKKRDHRKIAKEQDLLVFSDLVGSGMPLWTPKGNAIRNAIIGYSRELNNELGFGEVHTPNINKGELFKISGHYDAYKEDMLSVRSQYVSDEMFLKPMNCPQHTQIYASHPRSYRDLPIRYSDFAVLYRDERPGELSGLTRLRSFAQDDGHIFCREDQIESEVASVLGAIQKALATYKISYWMRLSLRDPENPAKFLGDPEVWEHAQNIMRELLQKKNIEFKEAVGEAAFYGPKIDIMAVDVLGREWQISTIQLDFVQPSRFKLEYTAEDGSKKTPVMIHRALIGSPDRFLGVLIEHYAGAFPLWLAPVQVAVLSISEKQIEFAKEVTQELKASGIRVELDDSNESLGKKIRNAKLQKIPYLLVIGDKEVEAQSATLESRDEGNLGAHPITTLIERFKKEITVKK